MANWLDSVWCCSFEGSRACAVAESTDSAAMGVVHIVVKAGKSTANAWRTRPGFIYVGSGMHQDIINWKPVEATTSRWMRLGEHRLGGCADDVEQPRPVTGGFVSSCVRREQSMFVA